MNVVIILNVVPNVLNPTEHILGTRSNAKPQ